MLQAIVGCIFASTGSPCINVTISEYDFTTLCQKNLKYPFIYLKRTYLQTWPQKPSHHYTSCWVFLSMFCLYNNSLMLQLWAIVFITPNLHSRSPSQLCRDSFWNCRQGVAHRSWSMDFILVFIQILHRCEKSHRLTSWSQPGSCGGGQLETVDVSGDG